jgi:hypothetical protein
VTNRTHSAAYYFYMARRVRGAYTADCERQSWYQLFVDAAGVRASDDASSCPQSPLEQKEGPA